MTAPLWMARFRRSATFRSAACWRCRSTKAAAAPTSPLQNRSALLACVVSADHDLDDRVLFAC